MQRLLLCAAAAALFVSVAPMAHADQILNLTLTTTANTGTVAVGNGTGMMDLNVAPSPSNPFEVYLSTNTTGAILKGLTFTIGGDTFDLSDAASNFGEVVFESGSLFDITYQGSSNNGQVILNMSVNGLEYDFSDSGKHEAATGVISLAPPAAAPEPSSLALLGTGVLGAAGVLRRRFIRN